MSICDMKLMIHTRRHKLRKSQQSKVLRVFHPIVSARIHLILLPHPSLASPQCRSRHIISRQSLIRVEVNTRVSLSIQFARQRACWVLRAGPCDVDVETKWVVLCTSKRPCTMTSDDLVAEDTMSCSESVVGVCERTVGRLTRSKRLRYSGSPCAVVLNQDLGGPNLSCEIDT
jgi:hypothetical protein